MFTHSEILLRILITDLVAAVPWHGLSTGVSHLPFLFLAFLSTEFRSWYPALPDVAQNSGRTVAQRIAQPSTKPKPFIPIFWSALGGQLRYCGNTPNGWDDLILQGKPDESKFTAFYTHGETVVAVATMMMDPVMSKCAELMRRGKMPSKKDIQGGVDVLTVDLPGQVVI
jgi:hypothetical protein